MLLDFAQLVEKYDMHVTGIIQVGAHWGQEYPVYAKLGIEDCVLIEPCKAAYQVLQATYGKDPRIKLFNCACGAADGHAEMYTSKNNNGQSNSLLKPKKHLDHYPTIQFTEREEVAVRQLDGLPIHPERYNTLVMDVQGAELLVLQGAAQILRHIEYIYTEINSQELYENNVMVEELDDFLADFDRVAVYWVRQQGWGDALYIRRTNAYFKNPILP
jgi:FkbM family methyltransferase